MVVLAALVTFFAACEVAFLIILASAAVILFDEVFLAVVFGTLLAVFAFLVVLATVFFLVAVLVVLVVLDLTVRLGLRAAFACFSVAFYLSSFR